jgi:hypothetical protein
VRVWPPPLRQNSRLQRQRTPPSRARHSLEELCWDLFCLHFDPNYGRRRLSVRYPAERCLCACRVGREALFIMHV